MKFEMHYYAPISVVLDFPSIELAAAYAKQQCEQNGYLLRGVASPEAWAKLHETDPPRLPPRATPPSGTPGCPTVTRIDPPVALIARAA